MLQLILSQKSDQASISNLINCIIYIIDKTVPEGVDGALEHAGAGQVELVAFLLEQAARLPGLFDALGREVHVRPADEAVFEIPGGFAVVIEIGRASCRERV